ALADGTLYLLQSRPITVSGSERERVRREEIAFLRVRAEPTGTVWARYSLAEVLPEPLPMSWSLWKSFMSGGGGYGRMYRELGYDPDPCLETDGVLDLIAGRPYFNLSRDARLYFRHFPYDYPFEKLKSNPELAIYPSPEANLARAPQGSLLKMLGATRRMLSAHKQLERSAEELPQRLESEVFPRIQQYAASLREASLASMSDAELLDVFESTRRAVFDDFASQGLKASLLAGLAIQELVGALRPTLGDAAARATVDALLMGVAPPKETDLAGALRRLAGGSLTREEFLAGFGHRGAGEMELANPRWRELDRNALEVSLEVSELQAQPAAQPPAFGKGVDVRKAARHLNRARRFVALREASKHYLMLGYEGLRTLLLEFDRRRNLQGGVFHLEPAELPALMNGADLRPWIVERRRRRVLALGIEAPRVLFSDDLDALGRSEDPPGAAEVIIGTGVAGGVAEGAALVLRSPHAAPPDARDFILVCPSTDPGWTPLFLRARAVVLETGGVLSHGAIVARELGLPAVANIPDACRRIATGQRLKVDGASGKIRLL
ncbi:MAG: PEP-utilizing enzyme, partial [Actinomycetota bacterium]